MKAAKECYQCLEKSIYQAAEWATRDEGLKAKAIKESLRMLKKGFSLDKVSPSIATEVHRAIREITQNADPYSQEKEKEIAIARELYQEINSEYSNDLSNCLKLAAKGNAMDFFKPIDIVKEDMKKPIDFVIDDSNRLLTKLQAVGKVLYLADNAGEVLFDLPLVRLMSQSAEVVYAVKASPVLNDITLGDLKRIGLEDEFGKVITTGTATPGIDFSLASIEFKGEFESADLVFAKGMAYYESLSEFPAQGKFFYCLMAKCKPVADSLKVPLNSYVALLS